MVDWLKIKNLGIIIRAAIIIGLALVVLLFFPAERKFRYEFQKGKPWQHENLIAPFNFPIYKLPEELKREEDSLKKQIKLYYIYQDEIGIEQIKSFNQAYKKTFRQLIKEDSLKRKQDLQYRYSIKIPNKKEYDNVYEKVRQYYEFVYNKGILDPTEISDIIKNYDDYSLVIYKNNLVKNYDYLQVFTLRRAYKYILDQLDKMEATRPDKKHIIDFFKKMDLETFIKPNLIFNLEKTKEIHEKELNEISETRGMVQAGELIISQGEVINKDKYRILMSLKHVYEQNLTNATFYIHIGNLLIVSLIFLSLVLFIYNYKPEILQSTKDVILIFSLVSLFIIIAILLIKNSLLNVYLIPIALLPVIIKVFYDERLALFAYLTAIFTIGFITPNSFEFLLMEFIAGFAAIFTLTRLSRRGQLYISVGAVLLSMSFMYLGLALTQEGDLTKIRWYYFGYFAINSLLLLLSYPLIYAFEKIFGLISDITLLELMNTNQPLLFKLSTSAPGTFQHSLQVANLAEGAAKALGANALLTRVGALYHDVGKIFAPAFFIENQLASHNPHDDLEFDKSAKIIINHVNKGIDLANKYNLPEQIIDFIRTHHGTSTVQYFYKNYIKKYPNKKDEIEKFKYPGPKPQTKENVILMMADSIEAASRSLSEYSPEKIEELVNKIIDYQMNEGQYTEADITFKEILKLKKVFVNQLLNIYHSRIPYPEN